MLKLTIPGGKSANSADGEEEPEFNKLYSRSIREAEGVPVSCSTVGAGVIMVSADGVLTSGDSTPGVETGVGVADGLAIWSIMRVISVMRVTLVILVMLVAEIEAASKSAKLAFNPTISLASRRLTRRVPSMVALVDDRSWIVDDRNEDEEAESWPENVAFPNASIDATVWSFWPRMRSLPKVGSFSGLCEASFKTRP